MFSFFSQSISNKNASRYSLDTAVSFRSITENHLLQICDSLNGNYKKIINNKFYMQTKHQLERHIHRFLNIAKPTIAFGVPGYEQTIDLVVAQHNIHEDEIDLLLVNSSFFYLFIQETHKLYFVDKINRCSIYISVPEQMPSFFYQTDLFCQSAFPASFNNNIISIKHDVGRHAFHEFLQKARAMDYSCMNITTDQSENRSLCTVYLANSLDELIMIHQNTYQNQNPDLYHDKPPIVVFVQNSNSPLLKPDIIPETIPVLAVIHLPIEYQLHFYLDMSIHHSLSHCSINQIQKKLDQLFMTLAIKSKQIHQKIMPSQETLLMCLNENLPTEISALLLAIWFETELHSALKKHQITRANHYLIDENEKETEMATLRHRYRNI